ncbi:carotenoid oxygenase family protein [Pseudomonas sp.]|uniref:carotenoid oxygenase family protein n=1 Tax=Pseudomonas sp. TaxID=306 RepID=UPI002631E0B3|nr:carotenoid oxygenase family protein [Pseudomonas sp.]
MLSNTNPFLQGPFEPLLNEYEVRELHVEGKIPTALNGTLYRTGTNQQFAPAAPDRFHWFDGDGMVHAFHLRDGRASYCNRWVETDGLKAERSAGRPLYNGIYGRSEKPQGALPVGAPAIKSVAGINVIRLANRVMTMHEVDSYYLEINPRTLETTGKFDFNGQVGGMVTAHPHEDPQTGEFLFYSLDNEAKTVECFATNQEGHILSRQSATLPFAPWIHDFIFTPEYYVFFFGPIRWRPYSPDLIPQGKSSWFFDDGGIKDTQVLLIHRVTGKTQWLEAKNASYMVGHFLNAYHDGDKIIVDASVTSLVNRGEPFNVEDFFPFPLVPGPSPFSGPELWRITLDPSQGSVEHERIGDFSAEFVRPNEAIMGQPHRYGYMACVHAPRGESRGFNGLAKHDYQTGETSFQHLSADYDMTPGEPIFVASPDPVSEDDGWILAVWYDPRRNASEMVILDAKNFDGIPVARIRLDHHVPLGFHGNWIADL